jgi:hypothetical protein
MCEETSKNKRKLQKMWGTNLALLKVVNGSNTHLKNIKCCVGN